jgi:hypothetical protein
MRTLRLLCLPALFVMCCSVCRAQDLTMLNGNWHLTGSWNIHPNDVRLFFSLGVQGDEIFGSGDVWTSCEGGGAVPLHGRIASDGTFVLRSNYGIPKWERDFSISGKIPQVGSAQWSGRFITGQTKKKCPAHVEGDFVATRVPLLTGVYSGTLYSGSARSADRTPVTVTLNITQEEMVTFEDQPGHVCGLIPLKATITLNGPLYSSDTLTANPNPSHGCNVMDGDTFQLLFPVGARFALLGGRAMEASLSQLDVTFGDPSKGGFAASGFLTRR